MANFDDAFGPMIQNEGYPGYVNDKDDHGGETVAGISRKNWPGAKVWVVVDLAKTNLKTDCAKAINAALKANTDFLSLVKDFYQRNFWRPEFGQLNSQAVANWLFDKAVNCGMKQGIKFLQRALGVTDDGIMGPQTINATNNYVDPPQLVELCRGQAKQFYTGLAENNPSQKKFLAGWLARA